MSGLISLADVPVTSVDSVYTGSSAPLALMASSIRAILRRTKSMGHLDEMQDSQQPPAVGKDGHEDRHARNRTTSPVAANSRRRRSTAPTDRPRAGNQSSRPLFSDFGRRINLPAPRSGSVELGSHDHRAFSSCSESMSRIQSRAVSKHRSPSRGRTRRRHDTPKIGDRRTAETCQLDQQSNIAKRRYYSRNAVVSSLREQEYSLSCEVDDLVAENVTSSYITKGVFRLQNHREEKEFRFPRSKNQPDPVWCAGDGFSEDEVSPKAACDMAGKHRHKRKRSRSLSALGKLTLEHGDVKRHAVGGTSSQPYPRLPRGSRVAAHCTEVDELWPTKENFTDSSIALQPKSVMTKDHFFISSASLLNPRPTSRPAMRKVIPRVRLSSEFENFGRRMGRSRSRSGQDTASRSLSVPQQLEYSRSSDSDEDEGIDDRQYERVGEGIEQLNMADDESNRIPATAYIFEASDSGSACLSNDYSEDQDTEMENAIID
ncbi:hypothetical protein GGS21DRAFT_494221 [Xylaria nigripes]|nr:hypothetical protein GGS21DRAFT_494221 [Xylaria nigripes]